MQIPLKARTYDFMPTGGPEEWRHSFGSLQLPSGSLSPDSTYKFCFSITVSPCEQRQAPIIYESCVTVTTVAAPMKRVMAVKTPEVTELVDTVEIHQPEILAETAMMQFGIVLADDATQSFLPITSYIPSDQARMELTLPSTPHALRLRVIDVAGAWSDFDVEQGPTVVAVRGTDQEILDTITTVSMTNATSSQAVTALLMLARLDWQKLGSAGQSLFLRTQRQVLQAVTAGAVSIAKDRPYHPSFALTIADTLSLILLAVDDSTALSAGAAKNARATSAAFGASLKAAGLTPHAFVAPAASLVFPLLDTDTQEVAIASTQRQLTATDEVSFSFQIASVELDNLLFTELMTAALGIKRSLPVNVSIQLHYTKVLMSAEPSSSVAVGPVVATMQGDAPVSQPDSQEDFQDTSQDDPPRSTQGTSDSSPGSTQGGSPGSVPPVSQPDCQDASQDASQDGSLGSIPGKSPSSQGSSQEGSRASSTDTRSAQSNSMGLFQEDPTIFISVKTVPSNLVTHSQQMYQPITPAVVVAVRTLDSNNSNLSAPPIQFALTLLRNRDIPARDSMAHCAVLVNGTWQQLNRLLPGMRAKDSYSCVVPGPGTYSVASRDFTSVRGRGHARALLYAIVPSIVALLILLAIVWFVSIKWAIDRQKRWIRNTEEGLACIRWKIVPVMKKASMLPLEVAAVEDMRTMPKRVLLLDDQL